MDRVCAQSVWTERVDRVFGQSVWTERVDRVFGQSVWAECVEGVFGQSVWAECVEGVCGQSVWNQRQEPGASTCARPPSQAMMLRAFPNVRFVGCTEALDEDLQHLLSVMGYPTADVSSLRTIGPGLHRTQSHCRTSTCGRVENQTGSRSSVQWYGQEAEARVRALFREDFEMFGFSRSAAEMYVPSCRRWECLQDHWCPIFGKHMQRVTQHLDSRATR